MNINLEKRVLLGDDSIVAIRELFDDKDYLIIYFYPRDNTPGCTKQACSFRDLKGDFAKVGASIVGVSKDSIKSHKKFTEKFTLNFPLISDTYAEMAKEFGVWQKKKFMGREYMGMVRSVFVLNKDGKVLESIVNAKAGKDEDTILKFISEL